MIKFLFLPIRENDFDHELILGEFTTAATLAIDYRQVNFIQDINYSR